MTDKPQEEQIKKEIELSIKIVEGGTVNWHIPKNLDMASRMLLTLTVLIQDMQRAEIQRAMEPNKPNIITSLKNNPIMKRILK